MYEFRSTRARRQRAAHDEDCTYQNHQNEPQDQKLQSAGLDWACHAPDQALVSRRYSRIDTAQSKEHFRLLELPPEMVQHVFRFITRTDISALRLTSKEVSSLANDAFASDYLRDLHCYFMNPARLGRLQNILSSSNLAKGVQTVTWTMDPFEDRNEYDICLATNQGQTREDATSQTLSVHTLVEHQKFHQQPPDMDLLEKMLRTTKKKGIPVYLDFQDNGFFCADYIYAASVWRLAVRLGCTIFGVHFTGETTHDLDNLVAQSNNPLHDSVRQIAFKWDIGVQSAQSISTMRTLLALIGSANTLEELQLDLCDIQRLRHNPELQALQREMLLNNNLQRLQTLRLADMQLNTADIITALSRCRDRLKDVSLQDVCLVSDGDPWTEVFELLRTIPRLHCLYLRRLMRAKHGKDSDVRFVVSVAEASMWDCEGAVAIGNGLDIILDQGLRYWEMADDA